MRFVIRVLIWSLLVGLVLAWMGWTPTDLVVRLWALRQSLPAWLTGLTGWAWPYVKQGAVIVVPLAVIGLLLGTRRRRQAPGPHHHDER